MQLLDKIHTVFTAALKKNLNASRPPESQSEGKNAKTFRWDHIYYAANTKLLHGIQTSSSPMVVTLGQQYNVGEKPTVMLYTYMNPHAGTPDQKKCNFCVLVSLHGY